MKRKTAPTTVSSYTKTKKIYDSGSRSPVTMGVDWDIYPASEQYEHVFNRVRQIKSSQVVRRYELYQYQQAYSSRFGPHVSSSLFTPANRNPAANAYAVTANVIKSCTDTACARISKEKPRAFVLPQKGDYRIRRKARKLQRFLDGIMHASGVYSQSDLVFRDGCIFGDGNLLIRAEGSRIQAESLKIDEVYFDQVDGMYDKPKEAHWVHPVSRRELLKKYPKFENEIKQARNAWRGEMSFMGQADMVEVIRSWRCNTTDDAKDGVYSESICTATLTIIPYHKNRLPIIRWHWTPPTYGCFGDGIAKELFGMQRAISDIWRGILKSIRLFAVPRIWVDKQANVQEIIINNEVSVNEYSGQKPVFDTPPAASPDIYQFVQWMIDYCYKQLGLSQLSAQSEKPAGVNSGVGLRNYQDIETQRFAIIGQRWEAFFMECASVLIDVARDLYASKKSVSAKAPGRGFIETMDWSDVSLEDDQYDIQVWPTNILPQTPEGKFQAVQEWISSGFMPKEIALSQMRMPILDDWLQRETAALDDVDRCIWSILDKEKYIAPDAIGNLSLAVTIAQSEVLHARDEDVEPHKQELLQKFLDECTFLKQKADNQNAQMQAAMQQRPTVGQAPAPPQAPLAPQGTGPVQAAAA